MIALIFAAVVFFVIVFAIGIPLGLLARANDRRIERNKIRRELEIRAEWEREQVAKSQMLR